MQSEVDAKVQWSVEYYTPLSIAKSGVFHLGEHKPPRTQYCIGDQPIKTIDSATDLRVTHMTNMWHQGHFVQLYGNVMTIEKKKEAVTVWPKYFLKGQSFPKEYTIWSREKLSNQFYPRPESSKAPHQKLPFITDNQFTLAKALMEDSLAPALPIVIQKGWHQKESKVIATVPTDSLLKIMMYKSDNF